LEKTISEQAFAEAAEDLGCEIAAIKAVAEVESRGDGFLQDNRPKILFERHIFSRTTGRKYDGSHPDISNRKAGGYQGGAKEHDRLKEAMALDEEAALKSASWGRFQIMGFNHAACGYDSVQDFVAAMEESEDEHLQAFVGFVQTNRLASALRHRDWAAFARRYNGPQFRKNKYDEKMDASYRRFAGVAESPVFQVVDIATLQHALNFLGADAGKVDGLWGAKTANGVRRFQRTCHLAETGKRDPVLMAAVQAAYYALGGPESI
jgi:hypothetical protein